MNSIHTHLYPQSTCGWTTTMDPSTFLLFFLSFLPFQLSLFHCFCFNLHRLYSSLFNPKQNPIESSVQNGVLLDLKCILKCSIINLFLLSRSVGLIMYLLSIFPFLPLFLLLTSLCLSLLPALFFSLLPSFALFLSYALHTHTSTL